MNEATSLFFVKESMFLFLDFFKNFGIVYAMFLFFRRFVHI